MKVLLVQSWLGGNEPLVYPLGLACLASVLRGHEVSVFDMNVFPRPFDGLRDAVDAVRPDVVGLSLRNIDSTNKRRVVFYYPYLREAVDAVRSRSDAKIVVGGSGFSMFAVRIMEDDPRIDYGVVREGEQTFPLLLENLEAPEKVPSVCYRKDGAVVATPPGPQVDLDAVPLPDRKAAAPGPYMEAPEGIGIETKRGCALGCVYCVYGFLNGRNLRLRAPSRIVDEVERLVGEHGLRRFTFVDSVFNVPRAHAEAICGEMIRRKIPATWSAWFHEKGLSRKFVELAREAGCRSVVLSPDGFSDRVLRKLGKNVSLKDIRESYEVLKGIDGIEISYNFFKNPPAQTLGAFVSMLRFAARAKRDLGRKVHFEFSSMRIEPNTKLCDIAHEEGVLREGEDLLVPKYYTQGRTRYIETAFDLLLRLKGK